MARKNDFNNLGPWIEEMCKEAGLPLYKVANRAGISRTVMYAWKSDLYRPDEETLLRVVQVFAEHTGKKSEDLLTEALSKYTKRPEGRPLGFKPGPREARAR